LARLHRAGELTAINIPTPEQEAVRDLCRARVDVVIERGRARHRLSKFLLRHSRVYRAGRQPAMAHEQWLRAQHFEDRALTLTYQHYQHTLAGCDGQLQAINADLAGYFAAGPFVGQVTRLACYRGVSELGGLTLASEVVDWRRFPSAASFMCFTAPGADRGLQRAARTPREDHQSRERPRPHAARRVRLVLPAPSRGRGSPGAPPARRTRSDAHPVVDGAAAPDHPVPPVAGPAPPPQRRGHRGRP
jgi:hypothetical protein